MLQQLKSYTLAIKTTLFKLKLLYLIKTTLAIKTNKRQPRRPRK